MSEDREPIPRPMKRAVRQRCGFGCIICGLPLYEYDHVVPYSVVRRHDADNIILLCDRHHKEKTNGLLPIATVEAGRDNPFNVHQGASSPYHLHYGTTQLRVLLGNNTFTTRLRRMNLLAIDGRSILSLARQADQVLLSLAVLNRRNELCLSIDENELVVRTEPYDVEFVGRRLVARQESRDILLDAQFDVPDQFTVTSAKLGLNGAGFTIQNGTLRIAGTNITVNFSTFDSVNTAVCLGEPSLPGLTAIYKPDPPRT